VLSKENINIFIRDGYCVLNIDLPYTVVMQAKGIVWDFTPPSFIPAEKNSWIGNVQRLMHDPINGR